MSFKQTYFGYSLFSKWRPDHISFLGSVSFFSAFDVWCSLHLHLQQQPWAFAFSHLHFEVSFFSEWQWQVSFFSHWHSVSSFFSEEHLQASLFSHLHSASSFFSEWQWQVSFFSHLHSVQVWQLSFCSFLVSESIRFLNWIEKYFVKTTLVIWFAADQIWAEIKNNHG